MLTKYSARHVACKISLLLLIPIDDLDYYLCFSESLEVKEVILCISILCCVTSHRKLSDFKSYPLIILQFFRSEVQPGLTGYSARGLTGQKLRCLPDWDLCWRLWTESTAQLIWVVGRSQFLVVVGLRFLFP